MKLAPMAKTKIHSLLLSLVAVASAFSPADHYLINCGSSAAQTLDADHRVFVGDDSLLLASTRTIQLESSDPLSAANSPLYRTARAFCHPEHYVFPIRDRGIHHLVRLHFFPLRNRNNLNEAEFHVVANGFLLLRSFRLPNDVNSPLIKEFVIPVDSGELKITFLPSERSGFAFVSAIEVITAPSDLIADVAQLVDVEKNERIYGMLRNGFETVYRVNVGGFKVTPFNDSLWRTWVTDDDSFVNSNEGSETVHFGGRIKYRMGGASREVGPDNVYNTARVIRSKDNSIPNTNLTWLFKVEEGYRYMIRMHFCDIASISTSMLYFNVYVNGNLAYANLDLSDITNSRLASPFYADFVANGGSLAVSVGPSRMSLPRAVDAILNGIEIWKVNNTMGSFDGEFCTDFVWRNWRKGHSSIVLPLIAAIFLLLSASVFLQRRRSASLGWSRLPVDVSESSLKGGNQLSSIK